MEKVSAVICNTYEIMEVYQTVKESIEKIGYSMPENKRVFIKPNVMGQNRPEQHTVTHPAIIDAICRILSENSCTIFIGDSSAFYQKGMTEKAFQTTGISEVAEKYGATMVPLEKEELVCINSGLKGLKELFVPKIILEVDLVINACKLKTHGSMRFSGALKNMFGCLPGGYKQKMHLWTKNEFELSEVFLDIHEIVKPGLSVMDAIFGLDGGPSAIGTPVKTSRIFASTNAAALDVVASGMIGYEPEDIATLVCAKDRQMIDEYKNIEVCGSLEPIPFKHINKEALNRQVQRDSIFVTGTYVYPSIDDSKCTGCSHCVSICPVEALSLKNGRVIVDVERCINCYRCFYECPENAIGDTAPALNKFMRLGRKILRL